MPQRKVTKKTALGTDLIESMKTLLAHQLGEIALEQVGPKPIDVKAIRKRVRMSQAQFRRHMELASGPCRSGSRVGVSQTRLHAHI